MKKPETKSSRSFATINSFSIRRVNYVQKTGTVFFDMTINDIDVFGCRVATAGEKDFIAYPSYKGTDGKYYSYVNIYMSSDDQSKILAAVEEKLNAGK